VRRNRARIPVDFVFQLTDQEAKYSRSQTVTLNVARGRNSWTHSKTSKAIMDADTKRQFRELRSVVFSLALPPTKE
jgi:lipocalin